VVAWLVVMDCRLKIKSDWSQSTIIDCNIASARIMQLVFLRRREATMVQREEGGNEARQLTAIDHCHYPLL